MLKFWHFNYWLMVASEELLEEAIRFSHGDIQNYFRNHLEEERGHAVMLKADLLALGITPKLHLKAASIAGLQYYLIRHVGPHTLLGYMGALESSRVSESQIEKWEARYGVTLHTVRYHALHDPDHYKQLGWQVDQMPQPERGQVLDNFLNTAQLINGVIRDESLCQDY